MKNPILNFICNLGLLISGSVSAYSGLLIQFTYHMGNHGGIEITKSVYGINYFGWSEIHKISIIFFSIFMIFHIILHWKWFKIIIRKNLFSKNRQVIILSVIFLLVTITGYAPWLIKLKSGDEMTRKIFIEIHDKLALILFVFLILHVAKRLKWFITTIDKMKNKNSTQSKVHAVHRAGNEMN
jgi:hypothetical protein